LTAILDFYLIKLTKIYSHEKYVPFTLIANYSNWFSISGFPRTLINSFETVIFIVGLFYWREYQNTGKKKSFFIDEKKLKSYFFLFKHQK
jgi:hypothetical protein